MKRKYITLAGIFVLCILASIFLYPFGSQNDQSWAYITRTLDGDTLEVIMLTEGHSEAQKLRLYGIDCPEGNQPFGREATQLTSSYVDSEFVKLEIKGKDYFGRTVAIVFYEHDGQWDSLNETLLQKGAAWWYEKYAKDAKHYETLQSQAHLKELGLWAKDHPIPPWQWRKEEIGQKSSN